MKNGFKLLLGMAFVAGGWGVGLQAEQPGVPKQEQKKMEQAFKALPKDLKRDAQAIARDEKRYEQLQRRAERLEKEIKEYQSKKKHPTLVNIKKNELFRVKKELDALGIILNKQSAWWSARTRNILTAAGIGLGVLALGYLFYRANNQSPTLALENSKIDSNISSNIPIDTSLIVQQAPEPTVASSESFQDVLQELPPAERYEVNAAVCEAMAEPGTEVPGAMSSVAQGFRGSVEPAVQAAQPIIESRVQEAQAYVEPAVRSAAERVEAAVRPMVQKVQSGIEYGVEQVKRTPQLLQEAAERGAQINEKADLAAIKEGLKERAQGAWNTAKEHATKGAEAAKEAVEGWSEQERRADEQEREAIQQGVKELGSAVREQATALRERVLLRVGKVPLPAEEMQRIKDSVKLPTGSGRDLESDTQRYWREMAGKINIALRAKGSLERVKGDPNYGIVADFRLQQKVP
jgi:hypothetical protein